MGNRHERGVYAFAAIFAVGLILAAIRWLWSAVLLSV